MLRRVGVLATLAALSAVAATVHAAPRGARLTWYDDPRTTVAIGWNSDDASDGTVVYGTAPAALDLGAVAIATTQAAPLGTSFTARLAGLAPGTTYFYRVGGAGGRYHPPATDPPLELRTRNADPCARMRFVLAGDNRADSDNIGPNDIWREILIETLAHSPDFFVNTGDMVKNGERPVEWSNFIDASAPGWALVPSLLTMGNHDQDDVNGDGALYNQLFELPRNPRTGTEDYYSLDVGPIHFVSLNTQVTSPGSSELTDMVAWLGEDLAATTQPWKIVFFHKAIYTRGNHRTGEENGGAINRVLVPLFDAHDVDLVFNGHSHDYERYAPSLGVDRAFGGTGRTLPAGAGGTLPAEVPDGATGTTYMVSGGAGALTTDVFGVTCLDAACTYCTAVNLSCDSAVLELDRTATVVYDGRHNFAMFDVEGDRLSARVYVTVAGNSDGGELIDAFTMTKTAFGLACGEPAPDAGVPAPAIDASVPTVDASAPLATDARPVGAPDAGGGKAPDGCDCRAVRAPRAGGGWPTLVGAFVCALALGARRRAQK